MKNSLPLTPMFFVIHSQKGKIKKKDQIWHFSQVEKKKKRGIVQEKASKKIAFKHFLFGSMSFSNYSLNISLSGIGKRVLFCLVIFEVNTLIIQQSDNVKALIFETIF